MFLIVVGLIVQSRRSDATIQGVRKSLAKGGLAHSPNAAYIDQPNVKVNPLVLLNMTEHETTSVMHW
jgi:hypothetical protein